MLNSNELKTETSLLSTNDFVVYFKAINDPDSHFYLQHEDVLYFIERILNEVYDVMFPEKNVPFYQKEVIKACKNLNNGI